MNFFCIIGVVVVVVFRKVSGNEKTTEKFYNAILNYDYDNNNNNNTNFNNNNNNTNTTDYQHLNKIITTTTILNTTTTTITTTEKKTTTTTTTLTTTRTTTTTPTTLQDIKLLLLNQTFNYNNITPHPLYFR